MEKDKDIIEVIIDEQPTNNKKIKLILEIKSLSTPEKETQAVLNVINMVKKMGMEMQVEYIAFSLHVVKELIRLSPKATVAGL